MVDPVTLSLGISWGLSAAGWLISPILRLLVNKCFDALGKDHDQRKSSLDDKLRDLEDTLLPQLSILTDAARICPHRRELEAWIQNLKSAYYEVEHLHGLVEYTQLEKKANSLFPPNSKAHFWYNSKLNDVVLKSRKKDLLKSLEKLEKIVDKDASKLVAMLNLSTNSVSNSNPRPNEKRGEHSNETISCFGGLKVIGRDKDREQIKNLLRIETPISFEYDAKCYSVIGIWGMGGSGKTTLAQYVCEYERKNSKYFDLVMWAHVSQNFSVKTIYKRILESLHEYSEYDISIEGLYSQLEEKLKGQRFLLVLDDAWCDEGVSEQQFQQLFAPLQEAQRGSKILVTTRIEGAAKALGATNIIPLRQLEHDEFLELFMAHALRDLRDAEKHLVGTLKQIGEQISAKLHRSPLAATTVAAQLRKRLDPDFWLSMLDQNLLNETMGALLLSYQNLPPPVQRCFAFCSLFPKGHGFKKEHLVSLWIGEGFIETDGNNKHVRDIGNEYISELISSSFLQVREDKWDTLYSIHDLLHDLAERVSNGEYFRIESGDEIRDIPTQTRHLYIEAYMFQEYADKLCKLKDLYTIIIWGLSSNSQENPLRRECLNTLFKGSKKLYVVDLYYSFIDGFPESVIYLNNLRYYNYGSIDLKTNLRYHIFGIDDEKIFQKVSSRLYQLRLLRGKFSNSGIPNVGRLTLLQDLHAVRVTNERGYGLEQLEHLRDIYGNFDIYDLHNVKSKQEARRAKLSEKKGLSTLELNWDKAEDVPRDMDADILDELRPPPQMKYLTIKRYSGKRCPGWFSRDNKNNRIHLKVLELGICPFLEALPEMNILVYLQSLVLDELPRLKKLVSLPSNLAKLILQKCSSLAFVSEEELEVMRSTRSGEQSPFDKELQKLLNVNDHLYESYLDKQKRLDRICQLDEVNRELSLPLTLEMLVMDSCFVTDKILASSLQDHTLLTHLELSDIIPITCIPREMLSSLTNLRILRIRKCMMLTSIGGFESLSSLGELEVTYCPYLTIEKPVVAHSSLKEVKFSYCKPPDDMFQALNSAERIVIDNCPSIQALDFSNSKALSFLTLKNCVSLVSLLGLNELNNLEHFIVVGCDKLQCPSDASKLPGLRRNELTISKVSMLELISRDGLSSLVSLTIQESEQEYFTPEECEILSHLSSLESIEFLHYKMQSLPDLSCLHSLTALTIFSCKRLISLSALPPSIQFISILFCNDEFMRSCEDTNHPNWKTISCIRTKYIN